MRIASIRDLDISNGTGIGVALFVQGCSHHCFNCFNPETWDFNGGKEFTYETYQKLIKALNRPEIKRFSLLGGEPFDSVNGGNESITAMVIDLKIRGILENKKIWIYSGYTYEEIINDEAKLELLELCDVLVDGEYKDDLRDLTLAFRGSSNQRIIDIKKSLEKGEVVLWEN